MGVAVNSTEKHFKNIFLKKKDKNKRRSCLLPFCYFVCLAPQMPNFSGLWPICSQPRLEGVAVGGSTCLGDPDSGTMEPKPPKPLAMMNFSPLTVDVTQTKELENCAFPSVNFVQKD